MQRKPFLRKYRKKWIIILFWLCVWQFAAFWTHNDILLVGPLQVGAAFLENIIRPGFCRIVLHSLCRIGLGFFTALLLGVSLGALGFRYPLIRDVASPAITTLKSIPVASFVVLLLIWFGSARLSFFISFFIVFPNVYVNTMAGLESTDRRLLEMAQVLGMSGWNRIFYVCKPALMPYLISCMKISLGMSWKSGVAAEVIGLPDYSLGERLYMSKIYLDTAGVFAWTLTIILLSFFFEKAALFLAHRVAMWKPPLMAGSARREVESVDIGRCETESSSIGCSETQAAGIGRSKAQAAGIGRSKVQATGIGRKSMDAVGVDIRIKNVSKAYGEEQVLHDFTDTMRAGGRYCLMAPSGSGKTTLFRLISRLEQADEGVIEGIPGQIGMVFQEDRLCESYDVVTNIMLTMKKKGNGRRRFIKRIPGTKTCEEVRKEAARILPEECLTKPVSELSGGMKRRCAILRAMLSGADVIMMDEPFSGLDEENRRRTAAYILERLSGRTLIVTTHNAQDAQLLDAVLKSYAGTAFKPESRKRLS